MGPTPRRKGRKTPGGTAYEAVHSPWRAERLSSYQMGSSDLPQITQHVTWTGIPQQLLSLTVPETLVRLSVCLRVLGRCNPLPSSQPVPLAFSRLGALCPSHICSSVLGLGATLSLHQDDSPGTETEDSPTADTCCRSLSCTVGSFRGHTSGFICSVVFSLNSHSLLYELYGPVNPCVLEETDRKAKV